MIKEIPGLEEPCASVGCGDWEGMLLSSISVSLGFCPGESCADAEDEIEAFGSFPVSDIESWFHITIENEWDGNGLVDRLAKYK